jgi:hypothetical protein
MRIVKVFLASFCIQFFLPLYFVHQAYPLIAFSIILACCTTFFFYYHAKNKGKLRLVWIFAYALYWSYLWSFLIGNLLEEGDFLGFLVRTLFSGLFYIWFIAIVISGLVASRIFSYPIGEAQNRASKGRGFAVPFLLICMSTLSFLAFDFLLSPYKQLFLPEEKIIALPDGFVGPAMIIFNHPDGEGPSYVDGVRIYHIPLTGILLDSGTKPSSVGNDFWYVDRSGQLIRQLEFRQTCNAEGTDVLTVCLEGLPDIWLGRSYPSFYGFTIGYYSDQEILGLEYDKWRHPFLLKGIEPDSP